MEEARTDADVVEGAGREPSAKAVLPGELVEHLAVDSHFVEVALSMKEEGRLS